MHLLVTRPQPDGERTALALRAQGHRVTLMPLMRTEPVADVDLGSGPWAAVVVTSANACRAIAAHPRLPELVSLPVFAVGPQTAAAARAAGFADVTAGAGDAATLARMVADRLLSRERQLLYLAGETRAADLDGKLLAAGFSLRLTVVYRMVAITEFSAAVRTGLADGAIDAVLHFSARSAQAFLAAAEIARLTATILKMKHYCLSAQVAAALQTAGAPAVAVAAEPSETALLDLLRA